MNKWKKARSRMLAAACTLSVSTGVVSTLTVLPVAAAEGDPVTVDVYPKPQSISYQSDEGMSFVGSVDVVLHGEQDDATLPKLDEILKANGISYEVVEQAAPDSAAIIISSDPDHCDECLALNDAALNEEQGYVLVSENDDNPKGSVEIVGADEDGAYYGVLTLRQMLQQKTEGGKFAETTVSDYPDIKLRGFVEGFYGYPWGFEGRSSLMHDAGEFKMNTYIYAPKDDPYHRDQWRTLYPEEEAEKIRLLAEEGKKENVSFVWSAHPGADYNYSTDDDFNALIAKFEQLYDLGVRQFGISYDDLGGYVNVQNHIDVLNRVDDEFIKVKGDCLPLVTVGTKYANSWGPSNYINNYINKLHDNIIIMWTGDGTMSAVNRTVFERPKSGVTKDKDVACWWNYPVNDYCSEKMMMARLDPLANDVDNLSGFFLNPLSQPHASKVAVFSGADWSWNVADFEADSSWERSILELTGSAHESFQRFADNISGHTSESMVLSESEYLKPTLDAMNEALSKGEGVAEAAAALKAKAAQMVADVAVIRNMDNTDLLGDIEPWLNGYEHLSKALLAAANGFEAAGKQDIMAVSAFNAEIKAELAATDEITFTTLTTSGTQTVHPTVGREYIRPFLNGANSLIQAYLSSNLSAPVELGVFSSAESFTGTLSVEGPTYTASDLSATLEPGGYIGYNLDKASKVSTIRVETETPEAFGIEYSLNGLDWTVAETESTDGILSASGPLDAAYVRVFNKTDEAIDANISSLATTVLFAEGGITVTTNMSTYQNYRVDLAADGNFATRFYSSSGGAVGNYIQIDLGNQIPIYDVACYFAQNPHDATKGWEAFKAGNIELSSDGVAWESLGSFTRDELQAVTKQGITLGKQDINALGKLARYIRLTCTQADDNWIQLHEIEYNTTVSVFGDDTVVLSDTNIATGNPVLMYDGSLETSYAPTGVADGDYVTYKMTTNTHPASLIIVQDENAISNAVLSVLAVDENGEEAWKELGVLDAAVNRINVDDVIKEVKLSFDGTVSAPKITEIILSNRRAASEDDAELKAALDALKALIDQADALDSKGYTPESFAAVVEHLGNAKTVHAAEGSTKADVEAAHANLNNALSALVEKAPVDKSELSARIAEAAGKDKDAYTADSWQVLETALAAANSVNDNADAQQADVDKALADLNAALSGLAEKPVTPIEADKSALLKALEDADKYDAKDYTEDSFAALSDAVNAAKDVMADKGASQEAVDKAAKDINDAIGALKEKEDPTPEKADKIALNAAIAANEGKDLSKYTEESAAAFTTALNDAKTVASDENATQAAVNNALAALEQAAATLKEKPDTPTPDQADTSALSAAIDKYSKIKTDDYTPESVKALNDAIAAGRKVLDDPKAVQADVDKAVKAIDDAAAALVKAVPKPDTPAPDTDQVKAELQAKVDKYSIAGETSYTAKSWAPFKKALDNAKKVLANKDATEAELTKALNELKTAYLALVPVDKTANKDDKKTDDKKTANTGVTSSVFGFSLLGASAVLTALLKRRNRK